MKIKELHLKNIASIEKADIDFTKDLKDSITGETASVFLISGDTGAGKSVLLDAIAMALYRKTPRTENVSNPMRNEFKNKAGEIIRVNSIAQYTRDGISPKDECYSEVIFEGNNGKDYKARLELGVYLSNTDSFGKRHLLHRKPKWTISSASEEYTGTAAEEVILSAIGLTFEQFCRMAMLAQGRFEAFLTGDKESREIILEQLTDTEKFSKYGAAISRIFKRLSDERKVKEAVLTEKVSRLLSKDEAEKLAREKAAAEKQLAELTERRNKAVEKNTVISSFLNAAKEAANAEAKLFEIQTHISSPEFKALEKFLSDWDATNEQRSLLNNIRHSKRTLEQLFKDEEIAKQKFLHLVADLYFRSVELEKIKEISSQLSKALEYARPKEYIYNEAPVICEKIGQLNSLKENLYSQSKERDLEVTRTEPLEQELNIVKKELAIAESEAKTISETIDSYTSLIENEQPDKIDKELEKTGDKLLILNKLKIQVEKLSSEKLQSEELKRRVYQAQQESFLLLEELKSKTKARICIAADYEKANSRFVTMSASLDEILMSLRKQLSDNLSDICPLCGQKINRLHIDNEFRQWLNPLEVEKAEKAVLLKTAETDENTVRSKYDSLCGEIKAGKKNLDIAEKALKDSWNLVSGELRKLEINVSDDTDTDNTMAASLLEKKIRYYEQTKTELTVKQEKIRMLRREKEVYIKDKAIADRKKSAVEKHCLESEKDLQENKNTIDSLTRSLELVKNQMSCLIAEISEKISAHFPDWESKPVETAATIKSEAERHKTIKDKSISTAAQYNLAAGVMEAITTSMEAVTANYPEWKENRPEPKRHLGKDIMQDWSCLLSSVSGISAGKLSCSNTITDAEHCLSAFYKESGITEEQLVKLTENTHRIPDIRRQVENFRSDLQTYKKLMENSHKAMSLEMEKLCVSNPDEIPVQENIKEEIASLDKAKEELFATISSISVRLNGYYEETSKVEIHKQELEKSIAECQKWDVLNKYFGGTKFRTLVQSHILKPLLNNANIYLRRITDRYTLTCNGENEQLSIFVYDNFVQQLRSATVLSGGEKFMISLALSLALSSLNRPDMNVNILFIDEGFGTLDEKSLDSVMVTLEKLQEIAGENNRRVGIISHREELEERIPVQIQVKAKGMGRSTVEIVHR